MATLILCEIIETNAVTVVALDSAPMDFLVRINGNIRPMSHLIALIGADAFRTARGPITA